MIEISILIGLLVLAVLFLVTSVYGELSETILVWPQEDEFWVQAVAIGFAGILQGGLLSVAIYYYLEATFCIGMLEECTPDPTPGEFQAAILLSFLALISSPIPSRLAGVSWPAAVGLGLLFFPLSLPMLLPGLLFVVIGLPDPVATTLSFSILWVGAPLVIAKVRRQSNAESRMPGSES